MPTPQIIEIVDDSAIHEIDVVADGQDITITIGAYGDADARQAISVVDTGGDGSLTYSSSTGVITYTGPTAAEVRAHFSAGTGINITNGVITNTSLNTDTTYTQNASSTTGGANLNLVGSDATTDSVKFAGTGATTVTRTDADTITISSTDTNTTYTQAVTAATGGANLNLVGSDSTTDTVKFAAGAGITVAETDASTITITSTITQYTDALARQAISVAVNTGDGDLTYNNTNGQFSYTGPTASDYRAAVSAANSGTGYGALSYDSGTGAFTFARVTDANIRGTVSAANSGTGYGSLSYDSGTGAFTYARVTDADIRGRISVSDTGGYGSLSYDTGTGVITYTGITGNEIRGEVIDGRNLTYTSGGSTLDLDKQLTSVNSITAESATNLTLTGNRIVLETRDVSTASKTLTIQSQGYNFDLNDTGDSSRRIVIQSVGTFSKTLYSMLILGEVTSGSNQITNALIVDNQAVLDSGNPLSWNTYNMVGYPFIEATLALGDIFPAGTTISSVSVDPGDPTLATVTMSANALQTIVLDGAPDIAYLSHVARSDDWSTVILVDGFNGSGYTANTITRTLAPAVPSPILITVNTGYVDSAEAITDNFSWTTTGTVIQAGARRVIELTPTNSINEHVRVPFALGVGPDAVMTNRGLPADTADAIGINILNNGKITGFDGKTGLNLTQYKNNSAFSASGAVAERSGPNFTFNSFAGDTNTANASLYLTNNDGLGQITWFAQPASGSLASSVYTPASITVKATETHNTSTKQGSGMYLQYTPNSQAAAASPRTFVRAENTTTEVLAHTTLKLGKISTAANSTARALSATAAADWVTINDSAVNVNSNLRITGGLRTYGEFAYTAGQITPAAADTIYTFPLDTTNMASGITISNTSRVNINRTGLYKLIMSLQVKNNNNSADHLLRFWLRKNSVDVANSATVVTPLKLQEQVVAMDWLVESDGDDYFEIAYYVNDTNVVFPNYTAITSPVTAPSAPPIILNVIPIGV